jgi:hypothetical protein
MFGKTPQLSALAQRNRISQDSTYFVSFEIRNERQCPRVVEGFDSSEPLGGLWDFLVVATSGRWTKSNCDLILSEANADPDRLTHRDCSADPIKDRRKPAAGGATQSRFTVAVVRR